MNKSLPTLVIALAVILGCKSKPQKEAVQAPPGSSSTGQQDAREQLLKEFTRKEAAFLGIPEDDPVITSKDSSALTPAQVQTKRALNTLLYIDGFVLNAKQAVERAGVSPELQKASEDYDLALLRADLIRGDIRSGRPDKATLRVSKITSPITPDERSLLEARNTHSDIQSLVKGEIKP